MENVIGNTISYSFNALWWVATANYFNKTPLSIGINFFKVTFQRLLLVIENSSDLHPRNCRIWYQLRDYFLTNTMHGVLSSNLMRKYENRTCFVELKITWYSICLFRWILPISQFCYQNYTSAKCNVLNSLETHFQTRSKCHPLANDVILHVYQME